MSAHEFASLDGPTPTSDAHPVDTVGLPVFAVTLEAGPPSGSVRMSMTQTDAAAQAIARIVGGAKGAIRDDGIRVTVLDYWVGTHPDGAMVAVVIGAPDVGTATEAAVELVEHALSADLRFADWRIASPTVAGRELGAP